MQAGIAEKKISILERALEFHPGSDRLLLALLDAVSSLSSSCTLTCLLVIHAQVMRSIYCWYRLKLYGLSFAKTGPKHMLCLLLVQAQPVSSALV